MGTKVWVCIAGEYSDQSVAAVFSNEADAKRCEELFNWTVNELELDSVPVASFPEGVRAFRASIEKDDVGHVRLNDEPPTGWEMASHLDGSPWYVGSFWARDEAHALDLAWEKLCEVSPHPAEALARNEKRKRDREEAHKAASEQAEREKQNREWFKEQSASNRAALKAAGHGHDAATATREALKELGLVNLDAGSMGIAFPWKR
jgi:hypothetical protein